MLFADIEVFALAILQDSQADCAELVMGMAKLMMDQAIGSWFAAPVCLTCEELADIVGIFSDAASEPCGLADVEALIADPPLVDTG